MLIIWNFCEHCLSFINSRIYIYLVGYSGLSAGNLAHNFTLDQALVSFSMVFFKLLFSLWLVDHAIVFRIGNWYPSMALHWDRTCSLFWSLKSVSKMTFPFAREVSQRTKYPCKEAWKSGISIAKVLIRHFKSGHQTVACKSKLTFLIVSIYDHYFWIELVTNW